MNEGTGHALHRKTELDLAVWHGAEQCLFGQLPWDVSYFMPRQSDRSVIIGKDQSEFDESNEDFVKENGIEVVRRLSGEEWYTLT